LYAVWQINTYTISYTLNGGSVTGNPTSYTIVSNAITLKNPTRTGYTFTGWTGSNGSTASTSVTIAKGSTGNKSYTANWRANSTSVDYIRYTYNSSNKITVYHLYSYYSGTKIYSYDEVNGLSNSGTISESGLYTKSGLASALGIQELYFISSDNNCYYGASTSSTVKNTFPLCRDKGNGRQEQNSVAVWETTTSNWYYSKTYECYIHGSNLSTYKTTTCYGN